MFFRFGTESPEIKAKRAQAIKEAYKANQMKLNTDENSWWNKVRDITFQELKEVPHNMIDKQFKQYYDMHVLARELHEDIYILNKRGNPRYFEHSYLSKLITDKEREETTLKQAKKSDDYLSPNKYDPNYMATQPRNTNVQNYNFEQYKGYTKIYTEQMEKDRQRQHELRRILKYIKYNSADSVSLVYKRKILHGKFADDMDIDHLVDESVDIEGYKPPVKMQKRRLLVKTKRSIDLTNYDCWLCFDRGNMVPVHNLTPITKIKVSPKLMRHVFGDPVWNPNFKSTGCWNFEDNNLDIFMITDPNKTEQTNEENKDPEYYDYLRKTTPKGRRERPRPTFEEFWNDENEQEFFIYNSMYGDHRKFKTWIRKQLLECKDKPSMEERVEKKYGDMFSVMNHFDKDYSKFNETGKEKVAVFNYKWSDFYNKAELEKYKNEIEALPTPAEYIPMDKAVKIEYTKAQLEDIIESSKKLKEQS